LVDRAHDAGGNAAIGAQHLQVILAAAFSAATKASGEGVPPSKTVNARSPIVLLKPSRNSGPRPVSTPSDSQAISQFPVVFRKRSIAGRLSTRSIE